MAITESDLTEQQKGGIAEAVKWYKDGRERGFKSRPVFKLQGPAGAGKSELGRFFLGEVGIEPGSTKLAALAPTGKAALVMRNKGLPDATTIHSGIYSAASDYGEQISELKKKIRGLRADLKGSRTSARQDILAAISLAEGQLAEIGRKGKASDDLEWTVNEDSMVAHAELVLCDEASMVGGQLQRDLESFQVPILYIGDNFQLEPIDLKDGSVFFDPRGRLVPVDYALTQIHRQAEGSAIIRYSRALREDDRRGMNFEGVDRSDDGGVLVRVPRSRLGIDRLAKAEQVICAFNRTRHDLNGAIREHLGHRTAYPEAGDKLICLKNNKELRLVNGMMGTALGDFCDYDGRNGSFAVDVEMDDGTGMRGLRMLTTYFQYPGDADQIWNLPAWSRKRHAHFDYGYCISCHKAQGSQYRAGIVIEEGFGRDPLAARRWRYTAATRFERSVLVAF